MCHPSKLGFQVILRNLVRDLLYNMTINHNRGPIEFSPLLSLLPIAVFVADDRGQIVYCNKLCLAKLGPLDGNLFENVQNLDKPTPLDFKAVCRDVLNGEDWTTTTSVAVTHPDTKQIGYYKISAKAYLNKFVLFSAIEQVEHPDLQGLVARQLGLSLLGTLGKIVFVMDQGGMITGVYSEDAGKSLPLFQPSRGTFFYKAVPPAIAKAIKEHLPQSVREAKPFQFEAAYTDNEDERYCSIMLAPLYQREIFLGQVVVTIDDVTEEKTNRQRLERKNRLIQELSSIPDGPILHLVEGPPPQYIILSGSISSLIGHFEAEIDSLNWLDCVHEQDIENLLKHIEDLKIQPPHAHKHLVYRINDAQGNIKWVVNHLSKSGKESMGAMTGIILDVTETQLLQEQLQQRERILSNTSKVALIGGWEYDLGKRKFNLTEEVYHIHEREPEEFNISDSPAYYVEEHQPIIRQHLHDLYTSGKNFDEELQLITGKGAKKWIRTVGCAEWHNGHITHIYGIIQDIDEKKKKDLFLKENENRFNAAFELAPLGIGLLSPDGHWLRVNHSLTQFFELPKERLLQLRFTELQLIDSAGNPFIREEILKQVDAHPCIERFITERGETKWGRFSITTVKDERDTPSYYIIQVVDITESKAYEEELIVAQKEAERANQIKSDFLSTMTHEIRTPLFGVIGITNLLLEEIKDPHHLEQLRALKFSSDSLLLLVNDILDFSKIKSGALSLEIKPFDVRQVVDAVEELHLPRAKDRNNTIVIDYDPFLSNSYLGDQVRIGQILNNLVNNAVKFTQNGLVEIVVKKAGELNNKHRVVFTIKDTGIGIPHDKQSSIFEQFTQADPSISRKYGGTGLGLSIAKGLTEAMGSKIHLASEPGFGTMISFELLLETASPINSKQNQQSEQETRELKGSTILLVEDNPVSMLVSTQQLKKWNAVVIQAGDGEKAVQQFNLYKDEINLVLMDIQIPVINGYDAAEQINLINPNIPIVAVTASTSEILDPKPFIVGYLIKPFSPHDFYDTIKKHLR